MGRRGGATRGQSSQLLRRLFRQLQRVSALRHPPRHRSHFPAPHARRGDVAQPAGGGEQPCAPGPLPGAEAPWPFPQAPRTRSHSLPAAAAEEDFRGDSGGRGRCYRSQQAAPAFAQERKHFHPLTLRPKRSDKQPCPCTSDASAPERPSPLCPALQRPSQRGADAIFIGGPREQRRCAGKLADSHLEGGSEEKKNVTDGGGWLVRNASCVTTTGVPPPLCTLSREWIDWVKVCARE